VPGHECFLSPGSGPGSFLFAYVGLGTGPELLPYLLALLAWAGAALVAVLQWPLSAFLRRLKSGPRNLTKGKVLGDGSAQIASEAPRVVEPIHSER
jgi:hypothetical protein